MVPLGTQIPSPWLDHSPVLLVSAGLVCGSALGPAGGIQLRPFLTCLQLHFLDYSCFLLMCT